MFLTLFLQNWSVKKILFLFFVVLLYALSASIANAATLSLSPGTGVYTAGQTFTARVLVNTTGDSINAAEGTLSYDTGVLSVAGVSKGPIFSLWAVDPTYSNSAGTVTFGGGSPGGYKGGGGVVLSVTFRAKTAGTGKVTFTNGSVLAADGRGTNVLTSMNSGSYTIAAAEVAPEPEVIEYVAPANTPNAPKITSATHNDQKSWYQANNASLSWTLPADVVAARTLLDNNSGSIPTKVYEPAIDSISLTDLEEGVQYFHLQLRNADGWGRVTHYRLAVDTKPPVSFEIKTPADADLSNPTQLLELNASDTTSIVNRYEVQIDGDEPFEFIDETGSSTLELTSLEPGKHTVVIEAFDQAGNSRVATHSFNILAFDRPEFTDYPKELNTGVIPVLKGVTRPSSIVTISVTGPRDDTTQYEVISEPDGTFTFIPDKAFSNGVYEIKAVAVDQYGAKSETSDPVKIAVQESGLIAVGSMMLSVLSVVVPLLATVLLLVFLILYFVYRVRKIRSVVMKEADEALEILEREFKKMRSAVKENEILLTKSRKTKKLTKAEAKLITDMSVAIDEAESRIKEEIEEVDDIVE